MQKKWIGVFLSLVTLFLIAGCTKTIPADEAATLLLDMMIYEKDTETFQTNFSKSDELTEAFKTQRTSFEENFTQGLLQEGDTVDDQVAAAISEALMKQVQEVTSYQVKQVTETKPIYHVTYEIQGFDLMTLFKESTISLLEKIEKENDLVKDPQKMIAATVEIMQEKIPTISAKEAPTEVTLQLKLNKGKWEIVNGQDETLASLYLAFYSGVRSQEELAKEMTQALTEIVVPSMEDSKK